MPASRNRRRHGWPRPWWHYLSTLLPITLLIAEFIASLTIHSLVLRITTLHLLVMVMLEIGYHVCGRLRAHQAGNRYPLPTQPLWFVMCYIAMFGLCFVNLVHAAQMLTHRHDTGVHHPVMLLLLGIIDFVYKSSRTCVFFVYSENSRVSPLRLVGLFSTFVFHTCCSISLLVLAALRFTACCDNLVLLLDPVLTIASCLLIAMCIYQPAMINIRMLLLATPIEIDQASLLMRFRNKFPTARVHEWHVWGDDALHSTCLAHVVFASTDADCLAPLLARMTRFIKVEGGVQKVVLQPEVVENATEVDPNQPCLLSCFDLDCAKNHCCSHAQKPVLG